MAKRRPRNLDERKAEQVSQVFHQGCLAVTGWADQQQQTLSRAI